MSKKLNSYTKIKLYNESNNVTLTAIDMTCELKDCVVVFLDELKADAWLVEQLELLKPYGIDMTYDVDKPLRGNILSMYENARVLKIACGKVWIG